MTVAEPQKGKAATAKRIWREARRSVLFGAAILAVLAAAFALFIRHIPRLQAEDLEVLKQIPPRSIADLRQQREVLLRYAATNPHFVLSGFCVLYVLMQTFAIPGTITLSLLSGALYGVKRGLFLVSVISTIGSCSCYCISWLLGKSLAHAVWPAQLAQFGGEVRRRRGELLNYIVFLRVTPLLPNTFINVASPIVDVPLFQFAMGTLVGCLPNNFVAVNAGMRLGELESLSDLYDPKMIVIGCTVGVAALLPVYFKHRHERRERQKHTPMPQDGKLQDAASQQHLIKATT